MSDDIDISKIISEIGEPKARIIESEEEKTQRVMTITFSLVALGLFIVGTGVFYYLKVSSMSTVNGLESEVAVLRTENAKLLEIEKLAISIKKRNQNAISLIKQNTNWSYVFSELEKIMLPDMILYKLETEDPRTININGSAGSYENVAKFMVSIENSEMFDNVTLRGSNISIREAGVSVEFNIVVSFAVSAGKDISRNTFDPIITGEQLSKQNVAPVIPQNNPTKEVIDDSIPEEGASTETTPPVVEDNTQPINNNSGLPTL